MREKERSIFHRSLYIQGFARVLWVTELSKIKENKGSAKVRVFWAEVEIDVTNPKFDSCPIKEDAEIRIVDLPIGNFILLHVNSILHKGYVVDPWNSGKLPFEKRTEEPIKIDFSRNNLTLFNRRDKDAYNQQILQIKSDRLFEQEHSNSKCFGVRVGDDPYAIIFPCVEIMRFFYCTSSTMANALFDGLIHKPGEHMYDESDGKSFGRFTNHVFITLKKGMLDSDARVIASLYADPFALKSAQNISINASAGTGEFRDVIAYPPFDGEAYLEFFFIPAIVDGKERLLVTRIIKSYHQPNFCTMEFDRENNAEKNNDEEKDLPDHETTVFDSEGDPNEETPPELGDGTTVDPRIAADLRQTELGARFPLMSNVPCLKIPPAKSDLDGRRSRLKFVKSLNRAFTTAQGNGKGANLQRAIIRPPSNFNTGPIESNDVAPHIGHNEYDRTLKLLKDAHDKNIAEIIYLQAVLPHFCVINKIYFNVYPVDSLEYFPKQSFQIVDGDKGQKIARMVLIVQVTRDGKTRFLVDFQQKRVNELSYQVFWFDKENLPNETIIKLKEALFSYAATKTHNRAYVNVSGLRWGSFKHRQDNVSETWIIDQVFKAVPKAY